MAENELTSGEIDLDNVLSMTLMMSSVHVTRLFVVGGPGKIPGLRIHPHRHTLNNYDLTLPPIFTNIPPWENFSMKKVIYSVALSKKNN